MIIVHAQLLSHDQLFVIPYSLQPHGLQPARLLCPSNFPDKNTAVGYHFLLQGIFQIQGPNPHLSPALAREFFTASTTWEVLAVKNLHTSAGNRRDLALIPGSGRSPRGGNGNPLQYSFLENPTDRGAWWAVVHGVTQSRTRLSDACTHIHTSSLFGKAEGS